MAEAPIINLALYAQTHVGMVRSGNEDNFLILDLSTGQSWTANEEEPHELLTYSQGYYGTLLAVSDGMGGALAGEVASRMAVETVRDRMLQLQAHDYYRQMPFCERLRLAIEEANTGINSESQTNPAHKGLGATFTAVATYDSQVYFAQVGDSRAYLIRHGKISRITKDQSLVQQLIDAGQITEEEAETHSYRNVILQALGAHSNVNVEVSRLALCQLDTLVLCSDGLSGKMAQHEIAHIVNEASDFKSACQQLIDLANERGGEDNITVVIAQFSGNGLPHADDETIEPQSLARSPDTPIEINWSVGSDTDPLSLSQATTLSENNAVNNTDAKATEPLPAPPEKSKPFTAQLPRRTSELPRTNDLSDRRGPITSVFGPEDMASASAATERLNERDTQVTSHGARTASLAEPDRSSNEQATSETTRRGESTINRTENKASKSTGRSFFTLLILVGLLSLGVGGLIVSATSYLKGQEHERKAQDEEKEKIKREYEAQKEGKIGQLREKIADVTKRLDAADKPALKEKKSVWNESLHKLSQRLEEIGRLSSDQATQISQGCDEISTELKKIEDEVTSLQGLIPAPRSNRDPIKI